MLHSLFLYEAFETCHVFTTQPSPISNARQLCEARGHIVDSALCALNTLLSKLFIFPPKP